MSSFSFFSIDRVHIEYLSFKSYGYLYLRIIIYIYIYIWGEMCYLLVNGNYKIIQSISLAWEISSC